MASVTLLSHNGTEMRDALKNYLVSIHTFVDVETDPDNGYWHKLYFTDDSYIQITMDSSGQNNKFSIHVKNDTINLDLELFQGGYYHQPHRIEVVQSEKGDILLRADSATTVLNATNKYRFSLCKCKHGITSDEKWAVIAPWSTEGSAPYREYTAPRYVITDDYMDIIQLAWNNGSGNSSSANLLGYNDYARGVVLLPLWAPSSEYVCENTYMVGVAKTQRYGDTVLGGKHYYFFDLIAMLDELT